ncbi:MAG: acyl-CoA thioesterase/BAAT N-terminal domain-containing protein [Rubrobacteraceae bacterium]|nr:acyl-CoA thioesterase/BAAT N-terminal domain-containing protein [Rubrobacteraceae bacterium]MCL6439313.1 acyl-CoA thioesterase/BAAT N-terminal domain-containing protein [Rubrobacteraceae bacterium]
MLRRCRLEASPQVAMKDRPVSIRVTGLKPCGRITLRARTRDERGRGWSSWACFEADGRGEVDLREARPLSGTYREPDPMGLFWSMLPEGSRRPEGVRFVWHTLAPITVRLTVEEDGWPLASTSLRRLAIPEDGSVVREEVTEEGLVGTFFHPVREEPAPAVLILGGVGGTVGEDRAALLASHGFAALALAYYRNGTLPRALVEIPLEYCERALSWLESRPAVSPGRTGVLGISKGGELALLLGATYGERIRAVVGYVPSSVVWPGIYLRWHPRQALRSSWTLGGEPLPFVEIHFSLREISELFLRALKQRGFAPRFVQERPLEDERAVSNGAIPVERIAGPVLLISGTDDRLVPSNRLADLAIARMESRGHPFRHEHLCYEGAGHSIGVPYLPAVTNRTGPLLHGGSMEANARASADSWPKVIRFLEESLGEG